ncbi:acyl-ACP--UDP-N-acetylglucosamine O-acyltransferase [Sulfurovum sp. NBC37-1]|uniref:Acyl-[acyl-carrier-protein]--UDP-N-acetylglucosamine O-acyltransferase n=1 Tax=Sulfurovum sp. (strain NBC37-1) TaxID=387093 RepID=LPXA_SULNB|nr:acyl-ACP--UDP-N-acetylglucosamine O-acyltransferase [Sulfurovum sp. NBC37-1]A6Q9A7.1 RecName: Full=Acyl-[acyl-carrier-protein]--UDP-N-acetylglucosamine O-acyltransferase; Short=UDP-N-acetylglucosamine acyltransferase [Sulfurovum sp. NBC37-1]BAF72066.1 acyl-[acyl-carrier-protein]--UDP-N-acetylglucosam O-acyltransferase [Sulfurovum sp. NBC37-1]
MSAIHPTAIVEDGAILGENVSVGPFAYIGAKVSIDDGTSVASHAVIEGRTSIGKNNRIFSHSAIGTIPQDLKYAGEDVELIIGDNNNIREFTLLNPGTKGGGSVTKIGNGNLLMGYVHLGHDVILGDNCILANGATLAGHVELGNNVVIGGLTPVHQFVHVGDFAMIGGASALAQDIPPYCLAEGNRATLRGLNLTGLRRHIPREEINALKSAYRELFEEGKALQDVAQRLFEESSSEKVKNLCKFIKTSKRGIPFTRKS